MEANVIRSLRLQRAWSQEQLAEFSGLSVRTIQRMERGAACGLESLKAIAATLEVDVETLRQSEEPSTAVEAADPAEQQARREVKAIQSFYFHFFQYALVMLVLLAANLITNPDYLWVVWPALGWGCGVALHGLSAFGIFDPFGREWERREIARRMSRRKD